MNWSDNMYKTHSFCIGTAMSHIKHGKKVTRKGWNGKGLWLEYVPATDTLGHYAKIHLGNGKYNTWTPSGSDALAIDWIDVKEGESN